MELGRRMARPGWGHTPVVLGLKPQQEGLLQPWVLGSQTPEAGLHLAAGTGGGRSRHRQPAPTLQGAMRVAPRTQCSWVRLMGGRQDIH